MVYKFFLYTTVTIWRWFESSRKM